MRRAFVGLGSNRGDRAAFLGFALRRLDTLPGTRRTATSPIYESRAVGPGVQRHYLNAVAELQTDLEPLALLRALLAIESDAGRRRAAARWTPRRLDLDLLLMDGAVLRGPPLELPHPRLAERPFVLEPLADLAPELIHPLLGVSVASLAERIRDPDGAWRWPGRLILQY